ncbi:MAG: hypothetical protein WA240_05415 [Nitrospirota bacterium]
MGHKIAKAIIENGKIKYINKELPHKKMEVHIIYDDLGKTLLSEDIAKIVKETSGIYKEIDVEHEVKRLREDWERNVHK